MKRNQKRPKRIHQHRARDAQTHADLDDAAERSLAARAVLVAQLDSITPRLIAFADLIGGPEPETDGTLAPRTVLN